MRILKLFLPAIFIIFSITAVAADEISVTIEGEPVAFADQTPIVVDGRTLVPVRGVFEHLGFSVDWDAEARAAILSDDFFEIIIPLDSDTFTTNGARHTLEVPAQSIGGRTMLPIRAVLETVGFFVDWDGDTRTVLINV
jgi:hypothetical protein